MATTLARTRRTAAVPTMMKVVAIDRFGPPSVLRVRDGGRVAYPNGVEPELRRRKRIQFTAYDAQPGPREFERLERAATEAQLRVPIAEVYPLAKAAGAHARLEEGHILGRIVLRTRSK